MYKTRKRFWGGLFSILIILVIGCVGGIQAQTKFPTRSIIIVCPTNPGGVTDLVNRIQAAYLSKKWGVPVNVVNKGGGIVLPQTLELYQTPADGYTVFGDNTNTSLMTVAVKDLPINILDRTFICRFSYSPMIAIVNPKSPFKSLKDLENELKKDPANFSYAGNAGGGMLDLPQGQFFKAVGFDASKRPTKRVNIQGGAETAKLVAGGHIKMGFVASGSGASAIKNGLVKPIAVAAEKRMTIFPDIPTTAEQGYPSIVSYHWGGISGPPKMPSHVVDIWEEALGEAIKDPELISQLQKTGDVPAFLNRHEFKEFVKNNIKEVNELLLGK
jgi:tripartite-type tricarboxylate transporter receptor subunit TctC